MTDRADLLTDLADNINQLTRPRRSTEYREVTVTAPPTNRRQKAARQRRRTPHTVTLPCLLDALCEAAVPGSADTASSSGGGFESRPSADLEPLSVLREITDDAGRWARRFDLNTTSLAGTLSALVSARHDDGELAVIARQADRWVSRARLATGFDAAPLTLSDPCPSCTRRNSLVVTGDLQAARCQRCGTSWDHATIGLLADMLRAAQEAPTVTETTRCCWADCHRAALHDQHQDSRGRVWRDTDRCVDADGVPVRGPVSA